VFYIIPKHNAIYALSNLNYLKRPVYLSIQQCGLYNNLCKRSILVIISNAFIKKENKVPTSEILKAKQIRIKYFQS